MESIEHRVEHMADSRLNQFRWALGLYGALSIAFGLVILIWPSISLLALTYLFGAFAVANGLVGLWAAFRGAVRKERGWLVVVSLLNLAIGIAVFVWPDISELALLYVIGAYAIAFGIILMGGAFWLPLRGGDRVSFLLTGVVSALFGIVMFAKPGAGALVLLALIAAFALVVGVSELVLAIGGKKMIDKRLQRLFEPPQTQAS
jgi:uncharacterized membrane protein HdeD (DUF308 family)